MKLDLNMLVVENVTGFMDTRFYGFTGVSGHQYERW